MTRYPHPLRARALLAAGWVPGSLSAAVGCRGAEKFNDRLKSKWLI